MVEFVIVIIIMGAFAVIGMAGLINYSHYQQYQVSATSVYETLREARSKTLGSQNDVEYGVYIASTSVTLFEGLTYIDGAATNSVRALAGVRVTSTLSSGVEEVIFSRRTGTSSVSGTVTVASLHSTASTTFSISNTGVIERE